VLVPFRRCVRCLPMVASHLPEWCMKPCTTLYTVGQSLSSPGSRRSSDDNFSPLLSFLSFLPLIYLFFNFNLDIWNFMFFILSNLIIILLIYIYFAFNLFSDWILFFDLIPNRLILIYFFVEFDLHSYDCNSFILSYLLD